MIDRQKLILVGTKYIAYLINVVIVLAVVGGVIFWVYMLVLSAK